MVDGVAPPERAVVGGVVGAVRVVVDAALDTAWSMAIVAVMVPATPTARAAATARLRAAGWGRRLRAMGAT